MTTEEVLHYLRVTPRTIYRLIKAGDIPATRVGHQWRFRRSDLDEWLQSRSISHYRHPAPIDVGSAN